MPRRLHSSRRGWHRSHARSKALDGRLRLLSVGLLLALAILAGRAVLLSATSNGLSAMAVQQQQRTVALPAHRGSILDSTGEVLAVAQERQTVVADPSKLKDPVEAARRLARVLGIKAGPLARALSSRQSRFAYVQRAADPALAKKAVALGIPGVGSYPEEKRIYPLKSVGAQLLGFVGTDNKGLDGLELALESDLHGRDGSEVVVQDLTGRVLRTERDREPVDGKNVQLTIDADIQLRTEQVLRRTLNSFSAKSAVAIVMNPRDGSLYAMANAPTVDANHYGEHPALTRDRAVADVYEPGSIFKVMTISAALQDKVITPDQSWTLPPTLTVGDKVIKEAHPRGYERFDVRRILVESSNVGAATIGGKLHSSGLKKWIHRFGFGTPTGVGLPGEARGILPGYWSLATIGNVPMGQGIATTPLQMAQAYAAVANGGVLVKPRLVTQIGGKAQPHPAGSRILDPSVCREVLDMMADVVKEGTGVNAQLAGYEIAGKTGTAQKADAHGGYAKGKYVASFVAVAPATHPQLLVLVMVDEPTGSIYGGDVAAPAARDITQFALQHLKIAP